MAERKTVELAEIEAKLEDTIKSMKLYCNGKAPVRGTGMYSILSKKYPLYTDKNVPPAAMLNMRSHRTPACADGGHVYFSSEMFKELWEMGINSNEEPIAGNSSTDMRESIEALIIHEYTHIVMEHVKRLKTFMKRSKNAKNIQTYTLACEIEANRGWAMPVYSYVYKVGVTEDTFPECKGVYGLTNIYNVLKKRHGDDVDNHANSASGKQEEGEEEGSKKPSPKPSSLSEKQKEAIEQMVQKQHTEQLMGGGEGDDSGEGEELEGLSISGGGDEEAPEKEYETAKQALQAFNDRYVQKEMEKDLSALKGVLTGEDIAISRVKTYSRPARRDGENGLMRKGVKRGEHNAPRILIGLDCSGSMDCTSMSDVMSTCASIIRATGTKVSGSYICTHDEHVSNRAPLHEWESVIRKFHPYGGNSFNELLREALKMDVDVLINLGDGFDAITDASLLAKAKKRGLKWVDVIVNTEVSKERLTEYLDCEESHLGNLRMERKVLKVK